MEKRLLSSITGCPSAMRRRTISIASSPVKSSFSFKSASAGMTWAEITFVPGVQPIMRQASWKLVTSRRFVFSRGAQT